MAAHGQTFIREQSCICQASYSFTYDKISPLFSRLVSSFKNWQNSCLTTEETCQIAERPRVDEHISVRTRFYIMARLIFLCVQQNLVYCLRRKKEKETSGTS